LEALEAQAQGQGATEERLQALESGGAGSPDLTGRMAEIEAALAELPSASDQASADHAPTQADALKALQDRLAALETRVPESGQVQETSAKLQTATLKLQDAESRLSQLSGSVDQLSQTVSADEQQGQALAGQISALGERLSGAENKLETASRNRDRAAALALLVGQLEAAIDDARPYQTQVQALTAMADDGAIKQAAAELEPGAASGVPSLATLRQSFEPVANEIVHAARAPDGNNLIDRATDNLMRLVTVRPVGGDVRGDSVDARVARAEASLNEGDLAAAVAELDPLEGAPAEAAAAWLQQAKARLGAQQALGQLRARATDLLTQTH
ncbi:MAG: COG4223 family protein, partial [Geminicoccales bacterium]